jgi:hypothetical protein
MNCLAETYGASKDPEILATCFSPFAVRFFHQIISDRALPSPYPALMLLKPDKSNDA